MPISINKNAIFSFIICLLAFTFTASNTHAQPKLKILTNDWPPYINPQGKELGTAAHLIDILFEYKDTKTQWHYVPYELAYHQVKKQNAILSYPYFKTESRSKEVIYSDPIFSVTSKIYYNRQFLTQETALKAYKDKARLGRVAGYSYGASIDTEVSAGIPFATEKQALTALFNNEIDLLPMTEAVLNHQLTSEFPLRKQLIVAIETIQDTSSLHVIASKNKEGQAVIDQLNGALYQLNSEGITSLQATTAAIPNPIDVAKLITAEGYPLITGQTSINGDNIEYFALSQGTQALVIKWSNMILLPSKTDRIYKKMMDFSKVVLLNGPHVGKELFVRNMHLELL